jgi:hypothetical protein
MGGATVKARSEPAAGIAPLALGLSGVGLIALVVLLGLATSPAASASRDSPSRVTCRGPASLGGFFRLTDRRKVAGKNTSCAAARKVVREFPRSCAEAYAAQGSCELRASARWRCNSRIAGSLADGAPSKVKCERRRSTLEFEVAYFPPTEPTTADPPRSVRSGPYDESGECIVTSDPGTVIPPPDLTVGTWELHLMPGVGRGVGENLQSALIAHRVAAILRDGLGTQPPNYPDRVPIFLTPGEFDSERNLGLSAELCESETLVGMVIRGERPADEIAATAAHELFHLYSFGLSPTSLNPWWEEASATWTPGRVGLREITGYDVALQYPLPLDTSDPDTYPYAMSRFVQFLDDRGFIGDPEWPLQRQVINGYDLPGATAALAAGLGPATTVGAELAAFWGDRLRVNPLHGPQLRPSARNAQRVRVRPGTSETVVPRDRLDTRLIDYTLAAGVNRVEFEFDPPPENGFFWGLVEPDESQPFGGDSVSFCVGGGDEDDLEWPGHFPVTFTNGGLDSGLITGRITIRAQTSADQCTSPLVNRACRLLDTAGVQGLVGGPAMFVPDGEFIRPTISTWTCRYDQLDDPYEIALLSVVRRQRATQARSYIRRFLEGDPPAQRINIGDLAGIWTPDDYPNPEFGSYLVRVAVGREWFGITLTSPGGTRGEAITLARRVAGELD